MSRLLAAMLLASMAIAQTPSAGAIDSLGKFATLQGRRLWFLDTGGPGVPIVFLHAGSGSSAMWERQVDAVRRAGYRFIAPDRVGSGKSVLDAGAVSGTAADDLEALITQLGISRFHLVGTAAGGITAFDYALSFPQRLISLTVANSIGGVQDEEYLAMSRRLRPSPQFDALPTEFKELGPSYRAADAAGTARWVELEHRSRPAVPLSAPQGPRNRLSFAALGAIRTPTLLITGDADLYTPPAVLRMFSARIKGAEFAIITEAGHSAYWEQADKFNDAVLGFVGRHR